MTEKQFLNSLANGQIDVIQQLIDLLNQLGISYCVMGGLAVNAYVEPVVSLDLDIIITSNKIDKLCEAVENLFMITRFPLSINLTSSKSDLRIQIQTDPRYQRFINNASNKKIMGYDIRVAALEDVLQGKFMVFQDTERRQSKRQKDLADIFRLVEAYPYLMDLLPDSIKAKFSGTN